MISTYIHARLVAWGDWVVQGRNAGRNGYPKQAAFANWMAGGGAPSAWSPVLDREAEEIDRCIRHLRADRRQLVIEYYSRTTTSAQLAKRLGCCEKTLFNRLAVTHQELLGMLNDLAAGIALPEIERASEVAA